MNNTSNNRAARAGRIGKTIVRTFLIFLLVLFCLLMLLLLSLRFQRVQNYLADRAATFVSAKIESEVRIGSIALNLGSLQLDGLYLEDRQNDTLLYAERLLVNFNLAKLLSKTISITGVEATGLTGRLSRNFPDSNYNFSFIPAAFQSTVVGEEVVVAEDSLPSLWKFELQHVLLRHSRFAYDDNVSGVKVLARLGSLEAALSEFDIDKPGFALSSFSLANTFADISMRPALRVAPEDTDTLPSDLVLDLRKFDLQNISVAYSDSSGAAGMNAHLGSLNGEKGHFSLLKQGVAVGSLSLAGSSFAYRLLARADADTTAEERPAETSSGSWKYQVAQLSLEQNTFSYFNEREKSQPEGVDFNHLLVRDLGLRASAIKGDTENASLRLVSMTLKEQSGLEVRDLSADIVYGPRQIRLSGLRLETGKSYVSKFINISYPSLAAVSASPALMGLESDLDARIALSEIRLLVPGLFNDSVFKKDAGGMISVKGKIYGSLDALNIRAFEMTAPGMQLEFRGGLEHVMNPSELYADVPVLNLNVQKRELGSILGTPLTEGAFNIPDSMSLKAAFKGYVKNFNADLELKTSAGLLLADIEMNPQAGNTEQPYRAHIGVDKLNLGYILKQPELLGRISMMADIDGSGFDTSNLDTKIKLVVVQAEVNKYNYTNLDLDGHFLRKSFSGSAAMHDRNLDFQFRGQVDLDPGHTSYQGRLDLKGADFKKLHLTEEDLRLSLLVKADLLNTPGQNPDGSVSLSNILLIKKERRYVVDSMVMRSANHADHSELSLVSDILVANIKGRYLLSELGGKMVQHLNSYFNFQPAVKDSVFAPQDYAFDVQIINPALVNAGLVPGLEQLSPGGIRGSFNSSSKVLVLDAGFPRLVYNGLAFDSLALKIRSNPSGLEYATTLTQLSDSSLRFENIFLGGTVQNNKAGFMLTTARDDSTRMLSLAGIFTARGSSYELRLDKHLLLNAEDWTVDSLNLLEFGKDIFYAENVVLSRGDHLLSVNSKERSIASPVEIRFQNFDISTVSKLMENKEGLGQGTINGYVQLENQKGTPAFKSDLEIRDFVFKAAPIGTIRLKADNYEDLQKYDIDLALLGNGNDLTLKGSYHTARKNDNLRLALDVRNLELASVEPFANSQVTRLSGSLSGKLQIGGEPSSPEISGILHLKEAAFNPKIIDSYLRIPGGDLVFDDGKVKLNKLELLDTLSNKATLDGYVNIANFSRISYDLKIRTKDFLAMNTTKKSNPLYYGRIFLRSDVRLSGTTDLPVIDARIGLNKGSRITYVKPESELSRDESTGVVEFTDSLHHYSSIMSRRDSGLVENLKGFDLDAVIDVDRSVDIIMIVDPVSGDSLFLQGGGKLDFSMDRSGKTTLTGKYTINEGGYYLSISEFVKRNFKIRRGSSVTWSGDVLDAYLDLDAIYRLKASPIDLVQEQMAGVSELEMNKYRNLLTFDVYLKMSGFISNPQISFDIQLAPEDRGALNGAVNTRLAQLKEDESQMNKQVFALLTMKRFIGENPLESSNEGGFTSASRSSASKVLTQQLSTLSDRYVNFVDLDLGVNSYEDYSSGEQQGRTQLQVGVSKQLLNDRVTVRVGGNVELEGERAQQNNANDVAGNVSIDYKLTKDGRYKLKAFRENQYENPIEGELVKTGAGVVFTRDFNKFRNLIKKPRRRNAESRSK